MRVGGYQWSRRGEDLLHGEFDGLGVSHVRVLGRDRRRAARCLLVLVGHLLAVGASDFEINGAVVSSARLLNQVCWLGVDGFRENDESLPVKILHHFRTRLMCITSLFHTTIYDIEWLIVGFGNNDDAGGEDQGENLEAERIIRVPGHGLACLQEEGRCALRSRLRVEDFERGDRAKLGFYLSASMTSGIRADS